MHLKNRSLTKGQDQTDARLSILVEMYDDIHMELINSA